MVPVYLSDRRGFLRIGAAGVVACAMPRFHTKAGSPSENLPGKGRTGEGRAKSVLLVILSGGPSQLDTLDPKPESPTEVRGEFSTISSTIPGVALCEHLPKLAQQTDRWAILRTLAHQTDAQAAYPVTRSWSPADVCTTLFNALGVPQDVTITDPLGRPHHLLNASVITPLYTGGLG